MCGIAGILNLEEATAAFDATAAACAMNDVLVHRGPDDHGTWADPGHQVVLAHRRLAIVDLSALGRNPMPWDGGRLQITFNGEIYNYRELRAELERSGRRFRSHTDTEVILAAYDEWGVEAVGRLAGMFAFALWDAPKRRLWIVRDRVGKKPLYYSVDNGRLAFASELKSLLTNARLSRAIDRDALQMYLRYGYVPAPHSIFESVRKLPPAHYLVAEGGTIRLTRYWDPRGFATPETPLDDAEAEARLEDLLGTAVAQRRIADVPLGAFLSGGIDSSLIVALMAEQSASAVQTHTIRFSDPAYNEADHAAAIARHLRTDHHETPCDERQMLATVDLLPAMFDEPFADSSAIPTYLVSAAARRGVTVALSGDGGDELFFGYPRYKYFNDSLWLLYIPGPIRSLIATIARHAPQRRVRRVADVLEAGGVDPYSRFVTWFNPQMVREITGNAAPVAPLYAEMLARVGDLPRIMQPGLLDLVSYLPDDILTKVDRASMAVSLEVRAPLLDHRVAEFAIGLPARMRWRNGESKWLLRRLLYKRVPKALVDRPKMGFGVPLGTWFRGPLKTRMDEYCESEAFEALGLNPEPIRRLWREFKAGAAHRPDLIWQAFALAAWSRAFVVQRP
jgi:asparagine synthase (glutamine-hydrolysing)